MIKTHHQGHYRGILPVIILLAAINGCDNKETTALQEELTAAQGQNQTLQTQLTDEKAAAAKLSDALQQAEKDKETAMADLAKAQEKIKETEEKLKTFTSTVGLLQNASQHKKDATGKPLPIQLSELKEQLKAEQEKAESLSKKILIQQETTTKIIQHYKTLNESLAREKAALEQELSKLKSTENQTL